MFPIGATCLYADCCFGELALYKSNWVCLSGTKRTSTSILSHRMKFVLVMIWLNSFSFGIKQQSITPKINFPRTNTNSVTHLISDTQITYNIFLTPFIRTFLTCVRDLFTLLNKNWNSLLYIGRPTCKAHRRSCHGIKNGIIPCHGARQLYIYK